jgi:hypothetical protein
MPDEVATSKALECDLCGNFPTHLMAHCHPSAPLRIEMTANRELVLYCYLPECNRLVARLKLAD